MCVGTHLIFREMCVTAPPEALSLTCVTKPSVATLPSYAEAGALIPLVGGKTGAPGEIKLKKEKGEV